MTAARPSPDRPLGSLDDTYLTGNGEWCPSCCLNGAPRLMHTRLFRRGWNHCSGRGRIVFTAEEIVARTVAEARAARERSA
ncbi:hypothetical protein [Methylobacterium oryzisoli]|uniref:hypothetical protein n=1 Tax=Methylobacterium oryzisoli TaxID=3385502 RepID=UPI00389263D9